MKRLLILMAFLAGIASCPSCTEGEKATHTLMTYNVGAFGKYTENSIPSVASVILQNGAEVVCLNELDSCNRRHDTFQLRSLADSLGGWQYHFARAIPYAGGAYGNGIVSRDGILNSFTLPLPRGDGREERSVAVVETPSMIVASAHLDYATPDSQIAQARLINAWFSENYSSSAKPVFLLGDMNAEPHSSTPNAVTVLEEQWERLSTDDATFPSVNPQKCIDYVFRLRNSAPVEVLEAKVLTQAEGLDISEASDHLPVLVRLAW